MFAATLQDLMIIILKNSITGKPLIWDTLGGNELADHSDVVGASPVDTAPPKSSFST